MEVSPISHRIIADLLFARTGQQLNESRRWRIGSALSGVFRERGISNLDQLVCLLADPGEKSLAQEVVEALLNNETYFYRDRIMFDQLAEEVLPRLAQARAASRRLSIWSAGCSTGQEALSLAMMFAEQKERWNGWRIEIVGTDISTRAIETAKSGYYTQFEIQRGLGVTQMLAWFDETPKGWRPRPELRKPLRFERRNLLDEPPRSGEFDLVLCRNVLLYFDRRTRAKAFERIAEAIAPEGWLMLGAGETVVGQTELLAPAACLTGLYRHADRTPAPRRRAAG
jgi:chemotaxis protein methyltransferase CheR